MAARKPIDDIRDAPALEAPDFTAPVPGAGGTRGGEPGKPQLPQPCPVTPLGVQGIKLHFLDQLNQLQAVGTECRKNDLALWFGEGWLTGCFPQYPKASKDNPDPDPNGFDQKTSSLALIADCSARGIFNPQGRVFGRGAHRARRDPAQLVLHMGRQVLIANAPGKRPGERNPDPVVKPAGAVNDSYFPALPALPAPADHPASTIEARALLAELGKWIWVEAEAAPLLLLGMIGQMYVCGALDWRSHVWLTAPTASGKSTLQTMIRAMLDDWCLATEDASEAAIRQILGDDTLPVMIDEAEAHDNPERLKAILNLMKKASSGAKIHRGGADHKGQEFTAQSCFLLSSVLHASMRGEDRNRIAILEMRQIPPGAPPLELDFATWRSLGRRLHRRMIEQWPRFAETLADYKRTIASAGFEGRWRDTYGTLLACADLLLFDHAERLSDPDSDGADAIGRTQKFVQTIAAMMARGRVEARSDVERLPVYLSTQLLPGAHGAPAESIGTWITRAMNLRGGQFETDPGDVDEAARAKLKSYGLRVANLEPKATGGWKVIDARPEAWDEAWLVVAYATNKPLCDIFRGSEWADGGWLQSLGKVDKARRGIKARFGGAGTAADNAIAVPLQALMGED